MAIDARAFVEPRGAVMSQTARAMNSSGAEPAGSGLPQDSAQLYAAVFQNSRQFIAILSPDGMLLEANQSAAEISGLSIAELRGVRLCEASCWGVSGACRGAFCAALDAAAAGRTSRLEARIESGPRRGTMLDVTITPLRMAGGPVTHLLAEGVDISARTQVEIALRDSRVHLQQSLDELEQVYREAPVGLCVMDRNFCYVRINAQLAAINGRSVEEHIGRNIADILPNLSDDLATVYRHVFETGKPILNQPFSAPLPGEGGVERHWRLDLYPSRREDGEVVRILVVVQEVSELVWSRQEVEGQRARLERQKRDLDHAQRIAGMGSWEWELGDEALFWSKGLYLLAGREPSLPPPSFHDRKRYYTPDSWARLRVATSVAASSGRPYAEELQFIREDGEQRWVLAQGEGERNARGRIVRLHGTLQDITERRRLEPERLEHSRRLSTLSRRLVAVQEEERRRLAGMVHDVVSPNVAALKINLGIIQARLPARMAADLGKPLEDSRALLDDTHQSLRSLCADLRPASLDYGGLVSAIDHYAQAYSQRSGIVVDLALSGVEQRLPPDVESLLFRIVQEALTNCVKHASASHVHIRLEHDATHASLDIHDDGIGFDLNELGQGEHKPGIGLLTMRERAEFAGGNIRIESRPGAGTRIHVEI